MRWMRFKGKNVNPKLKDLYYQKDPGVLVFAKMSRLEPPTKPQNQRILNRVKSAIHPGQKILWTLAIHPGQDIIMPRSLSTQGKDLCCDARVNAGTRVPPDSPPKLCNGSLKRDPAEFHVRAGRD